MDKTMQKRIEEFNRFAMNTDLKQVSNGLYNGKMGICIYFFELAHLTSEKKYRFFAEKLLDDVVNNVSENIGFKDENELTGICMAINYLLDKGYVTGNPNNVLKELDNRIIRLLLFNYGIENDKNLNLTVINSLLGNLLYLAVRLQNSRLNRDERSIIQNVIIENINRIETNETNKFIEPPFFSVTEYFIPSYLQLLRQIYKLHFFDLKIEKIIEGLSCQLLNCYPQNKANRLLLSLAMQETMETFGNPNGWDEHIEVLQQHLVIPQIIHEFRNKNVAFFNGLCGFFYLLRKTGKGDKYNKLFLDKISNSDVWLFLENKESLNGSIGLYGGLSGVALTFLHITHNPDSVTFFDVINSQYV